MYQNIAFFLKLFEKKINLFKERIYKRILYHAHCTMEAYLFTQPLRKGALNKYDKVEQDSCV